MPSQNNHQPNPRFRPWPYAIAVVLAAIIAQTAVFSPPNIASQPASITATPTPVYTVAPDPISIFSSGITKNGTVSIGWADAPRATSYEVRFMQNGIWKTLPADGINVTISRTSLGGSSSGGYNAHFSGLPKLSFYRFAVRSVNSVGTSRWVDITVNANTTVAPTPTSMTVNTIDPIPTSVCLTPIPAASIPGSSDNVPRIYPKLRSLAENAVSHYEKARVSGASDADQKGNRLLSVVIYLNGAFSDVINRFLAENKVSMDPAWFSSSTFSVQANVPVRLLGPLSELPQVWYVTEVELGIPDAVNALPFQNPDYTTDEITDTTMMPTPTPAAPIWHGSKEWLKASSPINGKDVKVGVIDVSFLGITDFIAAKQEQGLLTNFDFWCSTDRKNDILKNCDRKINEEYESVFDNHGTAVVEALLNIAPNIDLYIAKPRGKKQLFDSVGWMINEMKVDVINYSVGSRIDGPGDGTSWFPEPTVYPTTIPVPDNAYSVFHSINLAVDAGVVWINSAGNRGTQRVYYGDYAGENSSKWDDDGDRWMDFWLPRLTSTKLNTNEATATPTDANGNYIPK